MPRYYFNFRQNGHLTPDTLGSEFLSAENAYLEAFNAAQEMWTELLSERHDPRRCSFEIHDEDGNLLFVLPFWEILESCHDYRPERPAILETFRESVATVTYLRRAHGEFLREMASAQNTLRESAALIAAPL
ncbi:MAG TPA: hypothetical protein VKB67_11660 [Rhizomicrobium sp.]|nr:hypothetical protein [Rhizomicrobium sp.]